MTRPLAARPQIVALLAEVFREQGFEGASLSAIGKATGLGKGSLYHFFPGGKEEMANAVLDEIGVWFEREVFAPLASGDPAAVEAMFDAVQAYFRSGRRVCLVGAFALDDARSLFGLSIRAYFSRWIEALAMALAARGHGRRKAHARAEEIVLAIQGAIVLARSLDDPGAFERAMDRLRKRARAPDA
ncbi:MAG: TetR/AcrR family transcriptional regulator [Beijerinckiaceae bacterium]|nr:TetR/AcrR family transcriptional regulator [Beijerinckiaceae bacterium]